MKQKTESPILIKPCEVFLIKNSIFRFEKCNANFYFYFMNFFSALETNNIEEILLKYDLLDLYGYFRNKSIKSVENLRTKLNSLINEEVLIKNSSSWKIYL